MNTNRLRVSITALASTAALAAVGLIGAPATPALPPPALITSASTSDYIAGTGTSGCPVDGAVATSSDINEPWDALPDALGNTYITSASCNQVFRVDSSGRIWVFAGTGTAGSGGDTGLATAATLCRPIGLAVSGGAMYISEQGSSDPNSACNNYGRVVRKVDLTTGIITTVAGIVGQGGTSGDNGPATSAKLESPGGIAFDTSGNLYIADYNNYNIRKVDTGGTITTFKQFSQGQGVRTIAFDSSGFMYYAIANEHNVYRYDPGTTAVLTIGAGGSDNYPEGVAVDSSGYVYVTDRGYSSGTPSIGQSIQVVAADGSLANSYGTPATVVNNYSTGCASGATAADLQVTYPWLMHLTPDGKSLLVAIGGCNKIARLGPQVTGVTYTGEGYFKPVYPGVVNVIRGGSTVDLRFRVLDGTTQVTDTSLITSSATEVPCVVGAPARAIKGEREAATALRYVARKRGQGYFYGHWQAPMTSGTCYEVSQSAGGSAVVTAVFRTR